MRSCRVLSLASLLSGIFLNKEKSNRFVGGPLIAPRVPLPGAFVMPEFGFGFDWKHPVLYHCRNEWCGMAFGSHRKFGRATVCGGAMSPSPAGSQFEVEGEKGNPLWKVTIPEISQPPNA